MDVLELFQRPQMPLQVFQALLPHHVTDGKNVIDHRHGQILPKGTGYLTDLGMTGPVTSVLGIRPEQSVEMFLGGLSGRYQVAPGPCKMQGAVFSLDSENGLCPIFYSEPVFMSNAVRTAPFPP